MSSEENNTTLASQLLHQLESCLNESKHEQAKDIILEFNRRFSGKRMSLNCIFRKVKSEAELLTRLGRYKEGVELVERNRALFQTHPMEWWELLVRKGECERLSQLEFSVNSFCEALAVAEGIGDKSRIAETYSHIAIMFAIRYPALGIYFNHKAETCFQYLNDTRRLNLERVKRAKSSYYLHLRLPKEKRHILLKEAENLIQAVDTHNFNPFEQHFFISSKAEILQDEKTVLDLVQKFETMDALPELCRLEELYIRICVNKGNTQEALSRYSPYRKHAILLHGDEACSHLDRLGALLASGQRFLFEVPFQTGNPEELPTLLDILEHYSLREELWSLDKSVLRSVFPYHLQEDKFETVEMPDGTTQLIPCSLAFNNYYRGQSSYFEDCRPSLYREQISASRRFAERLKYEEFKILIKDHPMVEIFANEIAANLPDGTVLPLRLSVDPLALAQHYGIMTELMDLTCDKFVAAFFACTRYKNEEYVPITEPTAPGVFYHYVDLSLPFSDDRPPRLRAVGLQPFSRPGEQRGFVLEMQDGENFNDMAHETFRFRHNPQVSEFIFNYTNRSRKLFPYDLLQDKAAAIKASHSFSKAAYEAAKEEFYSNAAPSVLQEYMKNEGIVLVPSPITTFSTEEKSHIREHWASHEKAKMFKRIIVRNSYIGSTDEGGHQES